MPPAEPGGLRYQVMHHRGLLFPMLIVTSVLVIISPLPPIVMDLLLASNVALSVVILLTTIYVDRPLEFSVFPTILLGTTLARLVLNVATTRLILTNGANSGTRAAGGVIQAFGDFVAGGQIVIGLIIFVIIVAIQFLVITKGATRISEVAARFALDGMPGKQMAIDADLNAGLITADQAKARREEVAQQADFYGAMDGASKFVRGDSIAGIVITLINIVGGLYVGKVVHGMDWTTAGEVFTKLTIGDGLVSQIPAFLVALAGGLIVTRSSGSSNLPRDVVGQLFHHSEAMFLAAAFMLALSFTGLPALPLLALSAGCGVVGIALQRKRRAVRSAKKDEEQQQQTKPTAEPAPEDKLLVDPLELELGVGLIRLADPASGGDLLERVTRIRHRFAQELGIIMPKVRLRDNIRLNQREYQIKIRDVAVAWGSVQSGGLLAIDTGMTTGEVPGISTTEPAFGRPARWIEPSQKERAELLGFSVVEPSAVIITHLTEVVREHSAELLTREHVHELLENLKERAPRIVEELVPDVLRPAQVHQVLKNLLRERVPVRDLEVILQTLGDYADRTKDLGILTEYVRNALAPSICQQYRDTHRVIRVITLDPALEDILAGGLEYSERGLLVKLSPQVAEATTRAVAHRLEKLVAAGHPPIVLCSPQVRAGLKQITSSSIPRLTVLSLNEITRDTEVESLGQVDANALTATAGTAA